MESALEDEIVSINAIYSENTLVILSQNPTICALHLPGDLGISLRLEFSEDYPDAAPPSILGTQSVGDNVGKGQGTQVVDTAKEVLSEIYQPGSPCIFDLIEEINQRLQQLTEHLGQSQGNQGQQTSERNGQQDPSNSDHANHINPDLMQSLELLDKEPSWIISDAFSEKRSVFIAHAAHVSSPDEAKNFLAHLLATDKKVAKANHNITAWRIRGANDVIFQDCDDDGETAAGSRVLHLMQLMDVWDVMVVVSRWFDGTHIGPDRFRLINMAARDAFVKGGHVKEALKPEGGKKKGKR